MKHKVVVTGSCGFIGHHLVRALKEKYFVIGIDNLSTGLEKYQNEADEFIKEDIQFLVPADFEGVRYVFHTAAKARIPLVDLNPKEADKINVIGTLNILQCAKEANARKVIYSSSSSVYGDQSVLPLAETMLPAPKSNYGVQKLAAEHYCESWRISYGMPTVSLRYFNVFGEEQPADNPYTGVITKFLDFKRNRKPLVIYGSGKQTRDFTYVHDVVRANILAAENDAEGVSNIGGGGEHSIQQLAEWIGEDVTYEPERVGDTLRTKADIKKAYEVFGWKPSMNLESWIQKQL